AARGGDTLSTTIRKRADTRFHGGAVAADEVDRRGLAADLRAAIEGEVRFDTGSRALYATDASNYRMPPIGVVVPRHVDELVEMQVLTYRGERLRIGPGGVGVPDALAERLRALADANADEIRARYPQIPRRVSGYNLDELLPEKGFEVARSLVGTESTCVTILEATLELIPKPPCVSLLAVGYPDKFRTADHVTSARDHKPISIEGMDGT